MYKEMSSIDYINTFGCLREDQLIKLKPNDIKLKNDIQCINSLNKLKFNLKYHGCTFDETANLYLAPVDNEINNQMMLAIDAFIELKNNIDIDFFKKSTDKVYPSLLFFTQVKEVEEEMEYKRYDIIYCSPGSESIITRLIYDNELFENILVLVAPEKLSDYKELKLENNIRYVAVLKDKSVKMAATLKQLASKIK
ncbi:MAG: DUF5697 family protein [Clostridium sp.]